jgi:hypothetical protein
MSEPEKRKYRILTPFEAIEFECYVASAEYIGESLKNLIFDIEEMDKQLESKAK